MNAFSDELRKEREARGITLADIARKTRINIKYLEALEQGAFDVLPQTYIRAFIRSYAEAIGISATQFLHSYDVIVTQKYSDEQPAPSVPIKSPLKPTKEKEFAIEKEKKMRVILLSVISVVGVVLITIYIIASFRTTISNTSVQETPFRDVVKEQEQQSPPPVAIESVAVTNQKPIEQDSLILRAVATDSVWITITRDSLPPRTGYMLKGRYRTYFAKKEFRISMSDGGAIRLYLNGKELEPLGQKGERIRNVSITSEFPRR